MIFNLAKIMGDIFSESDIIRQELVYFKSQILPKLKKHENYSEIKRTFIEIQKHNSSLLRKVTKIITHKFIVEKD